MTVSESEWKSLDSAPREDAAGHPVKITLFLPGFFHQNDEKGKPVDTVKHGECVGHWDAQLRAWVHSDSGNAVYPSLWKA